MSSMEPGTTATLVGAQSRVHKEGTHKVSTLWQALYILTFIDTLTGTTTLVRIFESEVKKCS